MNIQGGWLKCGLLFACLFACAAAWPSSESSPDPYSAYKYHGSMPQAYEDWPAAQRKLEQTPGWQNWIDSRSKRLHRWQEKGGDRIEWIAGYAHDFFDPVTLVEQKWTDETPQPPMGLPGTADAKRFGGWVFYFRIRNVFYILEAARLYRLTGDKSALDWARSQLDLYADQYMRWPLQHRLGLSRMMGQSLDEAQDMAMLVPAIRLLAFAAPPGELAHWKNNLIRPMVVNLQRSFNGFNNISVWQESALAEAALLLNDDALWKDAMWGSQGVLALLKTDITKDTMWIEGTFGYSEYVIRALLSLLHEAAVADRAKEMEPVRRLAHDLLVAPISLRFPDGTLPNPGDNRGTPQAFNRELLRDSADMLPTPVGINEWNAVKDWPRLYVDWSPDQEQQAPIPYESKRMDATGFAMLRHQGWHLFLHFGQASPSHAQYEALSFELHHDLGRIVTDLGTTVYGSPLHQNYFTRAAAHNVPIINDRGQRNFALSSLITFDPESGQMSARQPDYQPGVSVMRSFTIDSDNMSDVIDIAGGNPIVQTIGTILHLDCEVQLPQLTKTALPVLPMESGFTYWQHQLAYRIPREFDFAASCKNLDLKINIKGPAEGVLIVGQPPVLDGRTRSAMYVRYPVRQGYIKTTYSTATQPQ